MPKITFIDHSGEARIVAASVGETLMEAGVKADIPELDAECGGACACGTCHVYVEEAFLDKVGFAGEAEQQMLDYAESPVQENSRLSCQIVVQDELDGMTVRTPAAR
ncbi:2Fe-2S iron-sulfur cluster-binding protein [Henriciella aquimarina]|uniref:2Fe-2S iron-sulfur cluster-binding protein n=1 Tax=Henriciella aquimarina TaxID=545261 RepID=UPI0009FFE60E|nr:2Fe-2S iron-sulfur cluster-binding protein [Henriciella aquimarina]